MPRFLAACKAGDSGDPVGVLFYLGDNDSSVLVFGVRLCS